MDTEFNRLTYTNNNLDICSDGLLQNRSIDLLSTPDRTTVKKEPINKISYKLHPYMSLSILVLLSTSAPTQTNSSSIIVLLSIIIIINYFPSTK